MSSFSRTEKKIMLQVTRSMVRAVCEALTIGKIRTEKEIMFAHLHLMEEGIDNILSDKYESGPNTFKKGKPVWEKES